MAKDVLITPLNGIIQFSSSAGAGTGQIKVDSDDLVISNLVGDVLLGDGASDVFIGNGTDNVDIVFEQNGEIRDDGTGKNLTIGSKTTNVFISGSSTIAMQKDGGKVGIGKSTATKELEVKGSISASGDLFANGNLRISGAIKLPQTSDIILGPMSTFPTTNTTAIQWDFPSDDTFIYAQQSSSDVTFLVFEQRDNTTSDANVFWFNDYRGPNKDSFPLFMDGSKLVVNYIYDKRTVFARDGSAVNGKSNNVDFYLLKSGSSSVSAANSLIFGDVSDSQVRINGDITASGNISLADDKEIKLGNSNDLRIFHDPNNGVIREDGGGDLFIQGSAVRIRENSDGGTIALFTDGAGTELRHDNVKKFETSDSGINVTGNISASGNISSSGGLKLEGGSFNLGGNTVTDAAIVLREGQKIYTFEDGQYFRNLIHKASDVIQIGQSGTSLVDEIRLLPGNAGFTTFYGNTTEVARIDGVGNITASGNISSSLDVYARAYYLKNKPIIAESTIEGVANIISFGDTTTPSKTAILGTNIDLRAPVSASGNISGSNGNILGFNTITATSLAGTLTTAAQTNITSLGTLTTLTVDDITINGSTISDGGDLTLDVAGDIILSADGDQISMNDGAATQFTFNLSATPELDVNGNFTIDGTGDIKLDSATKVIDLVGNVTASAGQFKVIHPDAGGGVGTIIKTSGNVAGNNAKLEFGDVGSVGQSTKLTLDDGAETITINAAQGLDTPVGQFQFSKTSTTDADHQGDVVFFGGTTSMTAGRIYHYKSDGTWEAANPNAAATSDGLLAVALGAASNTNGMLLRGTVTLDHDPGAVGDVLFLATGGTGQATATAPSGNNDIVRVIGYCLDASNGQIYFNPDNTFVEVSA